MKNKKYKIIGNCSVDIFHTGDETSWVLEVYNPKGDLVGTAYDLPSKAKALEYAEIFAQIYNCY